MKKLFIYSGLLSVVISFVVWVGTFGMASEKQHVMLSKQMPLGKDSIFIGLTPNYEESENYINFDCLLKSTLKHKPIIHNCKWSK